MKVHRVNKKAPLTEVKRQKIAVAEGNCARCKGPRTTHETSAGNWLPDNLRCGKCRMEAVR